MSLTHYGFFIENEIPKKFKDFTGTEYASIEITDNDIPADYFYTNEKIFREFLLKCKRKTVSKHFTFLYQHRRLSIEFEFIKAKIRYMKVTTKTFNYITEKGREVSEVDIIKLLSIE